MTPEEKIRLAAGKLSRGIAALLMIASAALGFYGWSLACTAHAPGNIFTGIILGLLGGIGTALFFIRLCLPKVSVGFVNFLLYPVRHLAKAPPVLSPIDGMITAGRYLEAEEALLALRETHPGNPQIARMLVDLYSLHLHQELAAFSAACSYFRNLENSYAPENLRLLMRLADLGSRCGGSVQTAVFLRQELESGRYPDVEKKQISARLAMLSGAALQE